MNRVHSFADIPQLYVIEGESTMGATRKNTPERLDKIIQSIWNFQDRHKGSTPTLTMIENEVGIAPQGGGYWINMLVDQGRLDKISGRPFRVTITDHPANTKAIEHFKGIRRKMDEHDEQERDRIRQDQERLRRADEREQSRQAVFAAMEDAAAGPSPTATVLQDERPTVNNSRPLLLTKKVEAPVVEPHVETPVESTHEDAVERFTRTRTEARDASKAVKAAMPQMLKVADTRDLVYELVERGYVVSKR